MITAKSFEDTCWDQGVVPAEGILEAARKGQSMSTESYEPLPLLPAIAEAGRLRRKDPSCELSSAELRMTPAIRDDFPARTLATILNASINPVEPEEGVYAIHTSRPITDIAGCPYAEMSFAHAIANMRHPKTIGFDLGSQIILDEQDEPLFIRKGDGACSSLALQEFVVNGIPYPSGSIAQVLLDTDYTDEETGFVYAEVPLAEVAIVPNASIDNVAFKRLSAYSFPSGERTKFGVSLNFRGHTAVRRVLKYADIDEIVDRAHEVMDRNKE